MKALGEMVWVMDGKTEHIAQLMLPEGVVNSALQRDEVEIRWTTGAVVVVKKDKVRREESGRRKRRASTIMPKFEAPPSVAARVKKKAKATKRTSTKKPAKIVAAKKAIVKKPTIKAAAKKHNKLAKIKITPIVQNAAASTTKLTIKASSKKPQAATATSIDQATVANVAATNPKKPLLQQQKLSSVSLPTTTNESTAPPKLAVMVPKPKSLVIAGSVSAPNPAKVPTTRAEEKAFHRPKSPILSPKRTLLPETSPKKTSLKKKKNKAGLWVTEVETPSPVKEKTHHPEKEKSSLPDTGNKQDSSSGKNSAKKIESLQKAQPEKAKEAPADGPTVSLASTAEEKKNKSLEQDGKGDTPSKNKSIAKHTGSLVVAPPEKHKEVANPPPPATPAPAQKKNEATPYKETNSSTPRPPKSLISAKKRKKPGHSSLRAIRDSPPKQPKPPVPEIRVPQEPKVVPLVVSSIDNEAKSKKTDDSTTRVVPARQQLTEQKKSNTSTDKTNHANRATKIPPITEPLPDVVISQNGTDGDDDNTAKRTDPKQLPLVGSEGPKRQQKHALPAPPVIVAVMVREDYDCGSESDDWDTDDDYENEGTIMFI